MKRQKLTITPNGNIVCVYHDENRQLYSKLGKREHIKISDITPVTTPEGDAFEATIRTDGTKLPVHESRNELINLEVRYVEENILQNFNPKTIINLRKY